MVEADAGRIKTRGIGERISGGGQTIAFIRSGRQGKRIQKWQNGRRRGLPGLKTRDLAQSRGRLSEAQAFVRQEKEGAVLHNRAAQHAAKVVLSQRCARKAKMVGEPVVGVKQVVAHVLEQ